MTLVTFLSPVFKKTFQPKLANAATFTKTWQLNQASARDYNYSSHELEQTSTGVRLKQLPSTFTLTAGESSASDVWEPAAWPAKPVSIVSDSSSGGNGKVYGVDGSAQIKTNFYVPINPSLSYTLSGRFKSVGTGGQSSLSFGLIPYVKNFGQPSFVDRAYYYASGDTATIASYNDSTITIQTGANLATWYQSGSSADHQRIIGFYFDGTTNRLPDFILHASDHSGGYSTASGTTINLNLPIPAEVKAKIIPGTTKIKNHHSGGTYLYAAAAGYTVPTTYTSYSATVTGTNTALSYTDASFPYETQWAKLVILSNLGETDDFASYFDDISLTITGSQPVYSWGGPSITQPGTQYVNGRLVSLSHTLGAGSSGSVKYQISLNGGESWLYYDTTTNAWKSDLSQRVTGTTQYYFTTVHDHGAVRANTLDEINANLYRLSADGIRFKWRAFLESDGTQQVELQSVTLTAENFDPAIASISPNVGQTGGGDKVIIRSNGFLFNTAPTQIAAGANHTCVLDSAGKAYCWGLDNRGQLGDGGAIVSSEFKTTPSAVVMPSGVTFTQLDSGQQHSCAIGNDQQVYCWGHGEYGQLGNNSTNDQSSPVLVSLPAGSKAAQISVGLGGSCALLTTGQAYCWGWNQYGQLGDGTTGNNRLTPVLVNLPSGVTHYLEISLGQSSTCAVGSDSNVYCWGLNNQGELGDGTAASIRTTPGRIAQGMIPTGVTLSNLQSSFTYSHYVLGSNGRVYAWGFGGYGALGNNGTSNSNVPVDVFQGAVPDSVSLIPPLGAGSRFACGLGTNAKAYCWGQGEYGRLGNGNTVDVPVPVAVSMPAGVLFNQISSVGSHACAIGNNNKIYCWGANGFGQLGNGDTTNSSVPVEADITALPKAQVTFGGTLATSVRHISPHVLEATVPAHAAGVVDVVVTNPDSSSVSLTNGYTYENFATPQISSVSPDSGLTYGYDEVAITGTNLDNFKWKQVSQGGNHTCAIGLDNKTYCWGWNLAGQLGDGTTNDASVPVAISQGEIPSGVTITKISTSPNAHTCGLGSNGWVYCWGLNYVGQLGNGIATGDQTPFAEPIAILAGAIPTGVKLVDVVASHSHTCALGDDAKVYCWGGNSGGQIGDGTTMQRTTPVAVKADQPDDILYGRAVTQVITSEYHTCVIDSVGQAYCWGQNSYGQLGSGSAVGYSLVPVAVAMPAGNAFTRIVTGRSHTCALNTNDRVYCWGDNRDGQLGDGTTTSSNVPVAVVQGERPDLTSGGVLSGGYHYNCVKDYCWGDNSKGQLGNGQSGGDVLDYEVGIDSNVPVATAQGSIPTGVNLVKFAAGTYHTFAIGDNHKMYCWGYNNRGQLGDGTTTSRTTPVSVKTANYTATFGDVLAPKIVSVTNTEVKVKNPSHTAGAKNLFLTNTILNQTTNNLTFTYNNPPVPSISSISPSSGLIYGGEEVTITGENLDNFKWRQVSSGDDHTCAIGIDNKAYCWGRNSYGQLGTGNTNYSPVPVLVKADDPADALYNKTVTDISAGFHHTCALDSTGTVYCWGYNSGGQLGTGSTNDSSVPVPVKADHPSDVLYGKVIIRISVGSIHTCAVDSSGKAYCWGDNYHGRLGTGGGSSSVPVAVKANDSADALYGKNVVHISASGFYHTCALDSAGKAYCWGGNSNGQLGTGDTNHSYVPIAVRANPGDALYGKTITQIVAADSDYTCALDSIGKVYCWGRNNYGRLGTGGGNSTTPIAVKADNPDDALYGKTVTQISAGRDHTCAIDSDGKAYCWGYNYWGQLGTGNTNYSPVPVLVKANESGNVLYGKTITHISAGNLHTCVLDSTGKAYCWGYNDYGRLGIGNTTDSNIPITVKHGYIVYFGGTPTSLGFYPNEATINTQFKTFAPAGNPGIANITLHSVSTNTSLNTLNQAYTFTNPPAPTVTSVTPSQGSTAGDTSVTVKATNLSNLKIGNDWTQIAVGNSHTCALNSDGKVYCWGNNYYGQLGRGSSGGSFSVPAAVKADSPSDALYNKTIIQITTSDNANSGHTCALDSDGKVYCWGRNNYGQLGRGSSGDSSSVPIAVKASSPSDALYDRAVTQISASGSHTCALDSDGKVYCWGYNNDGQLGTGNTNQSTVPVAVKADSGDALYNKTITQISAGGDNLGGHTCAIADNKAYCWGYNYYGQLGTGNTNQSTVPVAVKADSGDALYNKTITQISAGESHTCTLADDKAYCWGSNSSGRLGTGTITDSSVPVAVKADGSTDALYNKTVTHISAGYEHTCALDSAGKTYCWGDNSSGQLGISLNSNSSVPTAVQTDQPTPTDSLYGKTITHISAGGSYQGSHTCAIDSAGKAYCWGYNNLGQLGTNQSGADLSVYRSTPAYVMSKSDPLEVAFGTTAEHTAGTAPLATSVSSLYVPPNSYYIPGERSLTLRTPAHIQGHTAVVVTNADGQSSSNTIAADNSNRYTYLAPPSAPINLSANATVSGGTGSSTTFNIALAWTAPSNDGGSPITDYRIEYCESNSSGTCSGSWLVYSDGVSTTPSYTVANISASSTAYYSFRVSAINAMGTGPTSNIATVNTGYVALSVSSGTVTINVAPADTARLSSTTHNILHGTNNPTGINITLSMIGGSQNLTHATKPGNILSPATASASSPALDLPDNTWGYRINNTTFGDTTTIEDNVATSQYKWAKVPPLATPDLIHQTSAAATNQSLPIYYAAKTNMASVPGNYTGTVIYTAVARP